MKISNYKNSTLLCLALLALPISDAMAETSSEKSDNTVKFYGDLRLRYETVSQDNALADADGLTLRTRLGLKTPSRAGFSGVVELENSLSIIDDFSVPPTGDRVGEFSVIADPETTELDQAFVQYKSDTLSAKLGRQIFTLDGHRFVGHVGWRQDRQTFDALVVDYKPKGGFNINFSYIDQRNRIFSDEADIESSDTLVNTSYVTSIGKLTAYLYLLEVDSVTNNSLDTFGVSLRGSKKSGETNISYGAEFASQENGADLETEYLQLEVGVSHAGITGKLAYEVLGTDDGQVGFATPLATLHKFNGWSDRFINTPSAGLQNLSFTLGGKFKGGKWLAVYHDFSSDDSVDGLDDLGSEINLQYTRPFTKSISGGVKFADYSAGDQVFNQVDTQIAWLWASYKFNK